MTSSTLGFPPPDTEPDQQSRWSTVRTWLAHPIAPYYLLIGSAGLLLAIGLVMVL